MGIQLGVIDSSRSSLLVSVAVDDCLSVEFVDYRLMGLVDYVGGVLS